MHMRAGIGLIFYFANYVAIVLFSYDNERKKASYERKTTNSADRRQDEHKVLSKD